jgi:2-hydroxychromene-2-carboxylate isomerase
MRGAIVAEREGCFARYVDEVYRHMWAEPKKMDEPHVIEAALRESGLPALRILAGIREPDVKAALLKNTQDAVDRGVFGSPSFFVDDELYFGKDRLRDVEEAILRKLGS